MCVQNAVCYRLASNLLFSASLKQSYSFFCASAFSSCNLFQPVFLLLLMFLVFQSILPFPDFLCLSVSGWHYLDEKAILVAINPCMYFKEQDKGIFLE